MLQGSDYSPSQLHDPAVAGAWPGWMGVHRCCKASIELIRTTGQAGSIRCTTTPQCGSQHSCRARAWAVAGHARASSPPIRRGKAADTPVTQPAKKTRDSSLWAGRDPCDFLSMADGDAFAVVTQLDDERQPLHGLDRGPAARPAWSLAAGQDVVGLTMAGRQPRPSSTACPVSKSG